MIPRFARTEVRLRAESDAAPRRHDRVSVVVGAIVDDDDLELRRSGLMFQRIDDALQHVDAVVRWNDDGKISQADSPPSTQSTCPVIALASSLSRNAIAAATSSAVTARRIGTA